MGAFLIGCAVLALHSPGAAAEEDRCEGTRFIVVGGARYTTNDLPGCPKGGLLSGTGRSDALRGMKGDDEVRGRDMGSELYGGDGKDTLYGGAGGDSIEGDHGDDMLYGGDDGEWYVDGGDGEDVVYGGDGNDSGVGGGRGEDVVYGGDGNDVLFGSEGWGAGLAPQRDKLYCGKGKDEYIADKLDYVDSSCEEGKLVNTGGTPLIPLAGVALLSTGLMMSRYVIRRIS
jgi:Ca2+-binding RTX toxin-like protein